MADEPVRVGFAREVVAAKLHNYAALVVRLKLAGNGAVPEEIRGLERSAENKTTRDALRGLEGMGARLYFRALRESLESGWGFEARRAHPAPDPVNAMLSFGYSVLYNHSSTALLAAGLNPRLGLYHEERGAYHALACDLEEEFRHLVDALVVGLVHRKEVAPDEFRPPGDGRAACLMSPELRGRLLRRLEERLLEEFTPEGGATTTYRAFLDHQARRIREVFLGAGAPYRPLRAHS
jgi:CRISPR-associated protein Cas1